MSKVISNFQGRENAIVFKAANGGINSNSIDNPNYAKYIQNMVLNEDNNLSVRNGTKLVAEQKINENNIFGDQLKLMSYINFDGVSEILTYQTYFIKIPFINIADNSTIDAVGTDISEININITNLEQNQKDLLSKYFFNYVNIFVEQESYSDKTEIFNVNITNDEIVFSINLPLGFFDFDGAEAKYNLWIERAGIYKFIDTEDVNKLDILLLDLNPNVIVSYINYQRYLIICNGIDPVFYYDGTSLQELKSDYQLKLNSLTKLSNNSFSIVVVNDYEIELKRELLVDNIVKIAGENGLETPNKITAITFTKTDSLKIDITFEDNFIFEPRNILYQKSIPAFSYINVINDRLFALDSGGSYYKKFRSPDKSMLVYYCSKRKSIFNWYDGSGIINQINLASNSNKADDLQCFNTYQGRILFWGKESVQIWTGNDPTVNNNGQEIDLGDFRWQKTEPVGIFSKNMFVELPNIFVFLSKFGICSLKIDGFNNLNIDLLFAEPVNNYIRKQLENLQTEREYRSLSSFVYPYAGFIGFRFIHNCYIYQLKSQGFWTIFTQNFSDSKTFLYDSVSKNLYLSNKGNVLVYCDKLDNKNYMDMENNPIPFNLYYNWFNISSCWYNENLYLGCSSNEDILLKIKIYINYDMSNYALTEIKVNQLDSKYNISRFDIDEYSNNEYSIYPQETIRFNANSVSIKINGVAYKEFIFDSLYLSGGIQIVKNNDN
jgi:hypothetical protein